MRLIDADATIKYLREFRCKDCDRRKGMKNGKIRFCYEIGDAPCRACDIGDTIDYFFDDAISPTIDAVPVVRCKDCRYGQSCTVGKTCYQCFKWNSNEFGAHHGVVENIYKIRKNGNYGGKDRVFSFNTHLGRGNGKLIVAMVNSGEYELDEAMGVLAQACERCVNVLANKYFPEDGYKEYSEEWYKTNTECDFCRND